MITGMVNMTVWTLYASFAMSLVYVFGYTYVTMLIGHLLKHYQIRLKF